MRGAVYHYDQDQDFGYINGVDGKRYIFTRNDLSRDVAPQGERLSNSSRMTARPTL